MNFLDDVGLARAIRIPPAEEEGEFHITSEMLHLLQMKGLFGGQPHEDANLHLKNFIDVCSPFDMVHVSQKSIWL